MYKIFIKRLLDIIFSIIGLIVISPLFLVITIILFFQNNGKPFFYQERPGYKQQPFKIIKFKSMTDKKDESGNLLPDMMRITKIGNWIRATSVDEIPQFINVLKGDMSFVGPRPLLFKYIPLYSAEQMRRHEIKPGLTGWSQVKGRNSISWTDKFKYDVEYVDGVSFSFDFKIFLLTIQKVRQKEGVNQTDGRPMEPFNGTN